MYPSTFFDTRLFQIDLKEPCTPGKSFFGVTIGIIGKAYYILSLAFWDSQKKLQSSDL